MQHKKKGVIMSNVFLLIEMKEEYLQASVTPIGEMMTCPGCGTRIKKKTYQHKFCGPKCKDLYWNNVDPRKKNRKHKKSHYNKYNVGEKSYANRLGNVIALDRGYPSHTAMVEADAMDDGSWDVHGGVYVELCDRCGMVFEHCLCPEIPN